MSARDRPVVVRAFRRLLEFRGVGTGDVAFHLELARCNGPVVANLVKCHLRAQEPLSSGAPSIEPRYRLAIAKALETCVTEGRRLSAEIERETRAVLRT